MKNGEADSLAQIEGTTEFIASMLQASTEYAVIGNDLDGTIVFWNEGATRLYGYESSELSGEADIALLHVPSDVQNGKAREMMNLALREGKWDGTTEHLRKDGSRFPVRVVITLRHDAFGKPTGFLFISKDITAELSQAEQSRAKERRIHAVASEQAARNLRDSEERFRLLVESVQDYAILMLDREGGIVSWNIGAERLNGYRADEILGHNISIFYPPEDVAASRPSIELMAALADGKLEVEGWRVRRDGSRIWASVAITVMRDHLDVLRGFGLVMRDMTERNRAETEIRKMNATLEQRVRARVAELESFGYSVSHDLRAPLRAITGFSQILERHHRDALDEEGRHYLNHIVQASRHMGRMIDDLLSYSKIGHGAVDLQPVNLIDVLAETERNLSARIAEAGASLTVATDLPTVMGTWILLSQILTNLLDNALTYRRPDAALAMTVELDSTVCEDGIDFAVIRIGDNGIGIEPQYFDQIFTVFQRLHTQEEYPGTGIGLAIVSRAIGLMDGDIWLKSDYGHGTSFFVKLRLPER